MFLCCAAPRQEPVGDGLDAGLNAIGLEGHRSDVIVGTKIFIVALLISGLIVACVFSAGAAAAAAAAGAMLWQVGLFGGLAGAAGIGVLVAPFFAYGCNMGKHTGDDVCDTFKFIGGTVGVVFYGVILALRAAADIAFAERHHHRRNH